MRSYRRPLLALAAALAVSSLMSACVVVPARGYYRYHRYYGQAEQAPAPAAQAPAAQG
ncbi:MAG: hypothetical protein U1F53_23450 [Burkholderiaceae bacterium]